MALADTSNAIGAVTRLIADHLNRRTSLPITTGRPEQAAGNAATINLFLYEVEVDASMRNIPLNPDDPAPLWLTLKYLMTGFGVSGESDDADGHDALGRGMGALQEIAILRLDQNAAASVRAALESNPEPLKLTFEQTPPDLLNKIMQATNDEYRVSSAFQVRPVLIVPAQPSAASLLVGIDYSGPAGTTQADFRAIDVLPSLGPKLHDIVPAKFSIGDTVSLLGDDLHLSDLSAYLGDVEIDITLQKPNQISVVIPQALESGTLISAGEHPIILRQYLPETGRTRQSNLQIGRLLPIVQSATPGALLADMDGYLSGSIRIDGFLLGNADDTIVVALFADGAVQQSIEVVKTPPAPMDPPDPQTQLTLTLTTAHRIRAGDYQLIVSTNSQQALHSPSVSLAP